MLIFFPHWSSLCFIRIRLSVIHYLIYLELELLFYLVNNNPTIIIIQHNDLLLDAALQRLKEVTLLEEFHIVHKQKNQNSQVN